MSALSFLKGIGIRKRVKQEQRNRYKIQVSAEPTSGYAALFIEKKEDQPVFVDIHGDTMQIVELLIEAMGRKGPGGSEHLCFMIYLAACWTNKVERSQLQEMADFIESRPDWESFKAHYGYK